MPPKGSTKQPQMKAYTSYTFKEVTYEGQLLEGRGKRKKKRKEKGRGIRRPLALSSSPPRSHLETLPKKHEQQLERTSTSSVTTDTYALDGLNPYFPTTSTTPFQGTYAGPGTLISREPLSSTTAPDSVLVMQPGTGQAFMQPASLQ